MRTILRKLDEHRDPKLQEGLAKQITERRKEGDRLYEQMLKRPNFGGKSLEEAYKKAPDRVRNLGFVIRNMERHLKGLTESQISSTFGTTPDNVLRVLRLGYLNTARQDAFWEMGLSTAQDVFYWLEPKFGKTLRGATQGDIMYESSDWRSATDVDRYAVAETADGAITEFSLAGASISMVPVSKHTVRVLVDDGYVASDDGSGNLRGEGVSGKVDYDTGDVELEFDAPPDAGTSIEIEMGIALEKDEDLEFTQHVDLTLRVKPFTLREYPIYASFTKKSELLIGTTLDIEAEEAYLRAMADELRKSLDFHAFSMGYKYAKRNVPEGGFVEFDLHGAVGESEDSRIQVLDRYIDKTGNTIYNKLLRGGITRIYGGPSATGIFKGHRKFSDTGAQSQQGVYHLGSCNGIEIFRTPTTIVPDDTLVCMYKNPELPEDVFLMIGTLVPLHVTDKRELANRVTSFGVASYGDMQVLNKNYATLMKIRNT